MSTYYSETSKEIASAILDIAKKCDETFRDDLEFRDLVFNSIVGCVVTQLKPTTWTNMTYNNSGITDEEFAKAVSDSIRKGKFP